MIPVRNLLHTVALLVLAGCAARPVVLLRDPACLAGPPARVGLPDADEAIALSQREWERANQASPFVRAWMIETLPSLAPDLSDRLPAPRCDDDLRRSSAAALGARPLPFSRLLVAQLRTAHGAASMLDLIDLPEHAITSYAVAPEETGPGPSRALVRRLALLHAPDAMNHDASRRRLEGVLARTRDPFDLLLLHGVAAEQLGSPLPVGRAVADAWLRDIRERLAGMPDRIGLELVLTRLFTLGLHVSRLGIPAEEMVTFLGPILAAKGDVPLTRGIAHGAHDLAETARTALYDAQHPPDLRHAYAPPPPRRDRFRARDLDSDAPATGEPTRNERRIRLRDLDAELTVLRKNPARCWVLRELARWAPADEGAARFDAFVAPIFDGARIRLTTESLCRIDQSLELPGVDDGRRAHLLVDLLSTPPERVSPRDTSADGRGAISLNGDELQIAAAVALARHLDLVERAPTLRAWLRTHSAQAMRPEGYELESTALLQPAFERVLMLDLAIDPDAARATLRAWMASIRVIEFGSHHSIYPLETAAARMRALGDLGTRAGLAPEIAAFLRQRKDERGAAVAAYLLSL